MDIDNLALIFDTVALFSDNLALFFDIVALFSDNLASVFFQLFILHAIILP